MSKSDRRQYNDREIAALLIEGAKEMKEHIESQASVGGGSNSPDISASDPVKPAPDLIEEMEDAIFSAGNELYGEYTSYISAVQAQAAWGAVKERAESEAMVRSVMAALHGTTAWRSQNELVKAARMSVEAMLKHMEGCDE